MMWGLLLLSLTQLAQAAEPFAQSAPSSIEVLRGTAPVKSVVLVAHGLNNHSHALESLYLPLQKSGATIVLLKLRGHLKAKGIPTATELQDWKSVVAEDWIQDWKLAARLSMEEARTENVPLHFLGYSLGALVQTYALLHDEAPEVTFASQVLLAPAVRIKARSKALMILRPLGRGLILPSLSPEKIRSHDGTSIAAYDSLFDLESAIDAPTHPERLKIPTLVLMNADDELVSESKLQSWLKTNHLMDAWQVESLIRDSTVSDDLPLHYLINEDGLGPKAFARLVASLKKALL